MKIRNIREREISSSSNDGQRNIDMELEFIILLSQMNVKLLYYSNKHE